MTSVRLEKDQRNKSERKVSRSLQQEKRVRSKAVDYSAEDILKQYRPLFGKNNDIITNAQKGLAMTAVSDFSLLSGKSQKEIADLIHTTSKTLQNYASGSKKLPTLQSELLLKLFALYNQGLEVFDDIKSFNRWLQKPAFGLYNDIPETLLTTSTGINEVMDELVRIKHGDLA